MDEVSLALVADAWSRTYRSRAVAFATSGGSMTTSNGIRVVPDERTAEWPPSRLVSTYPDRKPADALDQVLGAIATRYGDRTAAVVAMQLEYSGRQQP
jgi:hypothetical protein